MQEKQAKPLNNQKKFALISKKVVKLRPSTKEIMNCALRRQVQGFEEKLQDIEQLAKSKPPLNSSFLDNFFVKLVQLYYSSGLILLIIEDIKSVAQRSTGSEEEDSDAFTQALENNKKAPRMDRNTQLLQLEPLLYETWSRMKAERLKVFYAFFLGEDFQDFLSMLNSAYNKASDFVQDGEEGKLARITLIKNLLDKFRDVLSVIRRDKNFTGSVGGSEKNSTKSSNLDQQVIKWVADLVGNNGDFSKSIEIILYSTGGVPKVSPRPASRTDSADHQKGPSPFPRKSSRAQSSNDAKVLVHQSASLMPPSNLVLSPEDVRLYERTREDSLASIYISLLKKQAIRRSYSEGALLPYDSPEKLFEEHTSDKPYFKYCGVGFLVLSAFVLFLISLDRLVDMPFLEPFAATSGANIFWGLSVLGLLFLSIACVLVYRSTIKIERSMYEYSMELTSIQRKRGSSRDNVSSKTMLSPLDARKELMQSFRETQDRLQNINFDELFSDCSPSQ